MTLALRLMNSLVSVTYSWFHLVFPPCAFFHTFIFSYCLIYSFTYLIHRIFTQSFITVTHIIRLLYYIWSKYLSFFFLAHFQFSLFIHLINSSHLKMTVQFNITLHTHHYFLSNTQFLHNQYNHQSPPPLTSQQSSPHAITHNVYYHFDPHHLV